MSVTRALHQLISHKVLPLFLPHPCLGCERLIEGSHHFIGLCRRCRGRLVGVTGDRCCGCGRPLRAARIPEGYRCGSCQRRPPAYDRLLARWAFREPLIGVIHGLKFERLEYLGPEIARELAPWLAERVKADLVTWVPLHWCRYLARGYNQAERLARPLATELGLPTLRTLVRRRATPAQTGLARERREPNLQGAFRVRRADRLDRKRLLLLDDVVTTGSTLRSAARELRRAGAAEITAVAVARTPGEDEPRARKVVIC